MSKLSNFNIEDQEEKSKHKTSLESSQNPFLKNKITRSLTFGDSEETDEFLRDQAGDIDVSSTNFAEDNSN